MTQGTSEALVACMSFMSADTAWAYERALSGTEADRDYWRTRALQAECRLDIARENLDRIIGG